MSKGAVRFVQSASSQEGLPDLNMPEVAFIGRSNVGKSTLIGSVLGRPKLVRTSRTPGRTQLLNLFVFREQVAIVDMPGYGFAKLPKKQRDVLDRMVQGYLRDRATLRGVVQLVDARRDPVSEYDRFVAGFILELDRPLLVAVTKIDLIPKNRRVARLRAIERQLGIPSGTAMACSGKSGEGRDALRARLLELAA